MKAFAGAIILAALLLQACASQEPTPEPDSSAAAPSAYTPQPGLSDKARFREVLVNLEAGNPAAARAELILYLDAQPESDIGQDLLRQIDLPADEYFPAEYREIPLEPGWSLSTVAQRYLGSVYLFHALAKYNGIPEPRKLRAGQSIRIPLTAQAIAAFEESDAGNPVAAPMDNMPDQALPETDLEQPLPNLPVAMPADTALPSPENGVTTAEGAAGTPGANDAAAPPEVAVDPEQIEKLHREALNAYRAQDLDSAIALWDEVLALDPDHHNASLYQSQAIDLKRKLSNLAN